MESNLAEIVVKHKPFLRWAGGKNWLLKDLHKYIPTNGFNNYVEPFLGGGSVFFHLQPEKAYLSDLNSELTDTYHALKEYVEEIILELRSYKNNEEFYYKMREAIPRTDVKRAARFIFLNQTSFNGIYRENLAGKYNVPYGHRTKNFLDEDILRKASTSLSNAIINSRDFEQSINDINTGDLVFIDPPYTVTHNDNGFIKYNSKLFDLEAQYRLSAFVDEIKNKNAFYILTNAAHQDVKAIFTKEGDQIHTVSRASLIGGKKATRGQYEEFIFTNTNQ
jgi:DNA adenine methylase